MVSSVANLAAVLILAPFLLGAINRTKALVAGRKGPPLLQVYFDLAKLLRKGFVVSRTTTWDCGYAAGSPRIQYSASSFAQMLVGLFRWAVLPDEHRPRLNGPFPAAGQRFESHAPDPVLDRFLLPLFSRGRALLGLAHVIQAGRLQVYLLYIVVTLVVLLAWSASW